MRFAGNSAGAIGRVERVHVEVGQAGAAVECIPSDVGYALGNGSLDGVLFDKTQDTLLVYPAGRTGGYFVPKTVTQIAQNAFYACGLTRLTIPSSVIGIPTFGFKVL